MENIKQEIISNILGDLTVVEYIIGFFWAFIGALISYYYSFKNRNKEKRELPKKFNIFFFIGDNVLRIFFGILLAFIFFRFIGEFFNIEFEPFYCILLGYGIDSGIINIKIIENKLKVLIPNQDQNNETKNNVEPEK